MFGSRALLKVDKNVQKPACDFVCKCNIANVGVIKGVAFVAVKITLNNEFLGVKNLEKSG